jgi:hypothetical protein
MPLTRLVLVAYPEKKHAKKHAKTPLFHHAESRFQKGYYRLLETYKKFRESERLSSESVCAPRVYASV